MNKQEAFDTIMGEFSQEHRIVRVRKPNSFNIIAPNNAEYNVKVESKGRDYITDEPLYAKVVVWQGPVLIHSGSWFPSAITAAKAAVAAVRNTGGAVQGELL